MDPIVIIDLDRCVGCFMCERACALAQCINIDPHTRLANVIRPWDCTGCKACERACPYNCIIVISDETEVPIRAKVTVSRVRRYMRSPVIFARKEMKLGEIAKVMSKKRIGALPYYVENELHIVTETDIIKLFLDGREFDQFRNPAIIIDEKWTVEEALNLMIEKDIGHLPVTDIYHGNVIGMLSIRDCLRSVSSTSLVNGAVRLNGNEKVGEFTRPVIQLTDVSVREAIKFMMDNKVKAILVNGKLFTVRDAIKAISLGEVEVKAVGRDPIILEEHEKVARAIALMEEKNMRHIIVRKSDSYGILSVKEIARGVAWILTI